MALVRVVSSPYVPSPYSLVPIPCISEQPGT